MAAIYFERAPGFANALISNRDVHDLARYQQDARLLLGPIVSDALAIAGLLTAHAFVHIDLARLAGWTGRGAVSVLDLARGAWSDLARGRAGRAGAVLALVGGSLLLIGRARPLLAAGLGVGLLIGLLLLGDDRPSARTNTRPSRMQTVVVTALMASVAAALILFRIGDHDYREDEFQVISAAYTHAQVGTYHSWDWIADQPSDGIPYTRAQEHTWLIARFIEEFGMSEGITRLPGAIAGILLTALAYPMMLRVTRSRVAAGATSALILLSFVGVFRYARMYALVAPVAFLWTFVHAEALRALPRSFAKGSLLLGLSAGIGALAYQLHVNTLSLAAAFTLPSAFILHRALRERGWSERRLLAGWAGVAVAALPAAWLVGQRVQGFLSPFGRRNFAYVDILFSNPLPTSLAEPVGAVLTGVALGLLFRRPQTTGDRHPFPTLAYSSVAFAMPFFVFIADRYVGSLYVAHVHVLILALMAIGFGALLGRVGRRTWRLAAGLFVAGLLVAQLPGRAPGLYFDATSYGVHSEAYAILAERVDPRTDVILGQYFRSYYARDANLADTPFVGMLNNRLFTLEEFEDAASSRERAWITWEARKGDHLRSDVKEAIRERGVQVSGPGVDHTRVFVYLIE